MPICPACNRESPEGFQHCGFCGASLATPAVERRTLATLLFCDLSGSTALGEQADAESVKELLHSYFHEMRTVIERHGGTVEKFIGDAVVAAFGVPEVHEDDALRACRAALEMQERMTELSAGLAERFGTRITVRIGLNTGEVVIGGAMGSELFATGDAVNVAARLEQAAGPGEVLLGESTFRLVRGAVRVEATESLNAKGKSNPVDAYRLLEVTNLGPARRTLGTPFAGRIAELGLLEREFEDACAGRRCRVVTLVGEPGVGKSRLVAEFLAQVETARARVARGRCLSYGEGITFWAVREIVRELAGIRDEHSVAQARALIEEHVAGAGNANVVAAKIAQLLGLADGVATAEETAWAIRLFLTARLRGEPLVVVVEDIHWAEPALLDLLIGLPSAITGDPVMVICTARPELLAHRPAWEATVRLEPLDAGDVDGLLAAMLGTAPAAVRRRLTHASAGNPLFAEELVAMLLDDGVLSVDDGTCTVHGDLGALALPVSLHAILGSRLDGLGSGERASLERGAVEGEVFHRGAVVELSPPAARPTVAQGLEALAGKDLVRPAEASFEGETAFRFKHILVRDAAYQTTSKRLRALLHEEFAGWLERAAGERVAEYEEILGHHLEQGHRYRTELGLFDEETNALGERAAGRLVSAGRRAAGRGDRGAAVNLLGRAAALLPGESRGRVEVAIDLVEPLAGLAMVADAERVVEEAAETATRLGDDRLVARVDMERIWLAVSAQATTFAVSSALDNTSRATPVLEREHDHVGLARVQEIVAMVDYYYGRLSEAAAAAAEGLVHAERAHDTQQQGQLRLVRMHAAQNGFTPLDEVNRLLEDDLDWARQTGSLGVGAKATLRLSAVRGELGDATGRDELFTRGVSSCAELGLESWASGFVAMWIWRLTEDPAVAELRLRQSYDLIAAAGQRWRLSTIATILAECLYLQGRDDEAEAMLDEAAESAHDDDQVTQVRLRTGRAKLLAKRGDGEKAATLAGEAVAIARETEWVYLRGDSLLALADVLETGGSYDESADAIREALALWQAKGAVTSERAARAVLAGLGEGILTE